MMQLDELERIGAKKTFLVLFADFDQKSGQKIRVCIKDWLITFYWGEKFPKGFLKKLTGRSPALKWVVNELSIQFLSEDMVITKIGTKICICLQYFEFSTMAKVPKNFFLRAYPFKLIKIYACRRRSCGCFIPLRSRISVKMEYLCWIFPFGLF